MHILQCEQHTEEWHRARSGIPTGSGADKLITPKQLKQSTGKQYDDYLFAKVAEHQTQIAQDQGGAKSYWMYRGIEMEDEAIEAYSFIHDARVDKVGFVASSDFRCGCSPDGLVGDKGVVQVKCPSPGVHVKYQYNNEIPVEYRPQVWLELLATDSDYLDFFSYHPDLEPVTIRLVRSQIVKELDILWDILGRFQEQKLGIVRQLGLPEKTWLQQELEL